MAKYSVLLEAVNFSTSRGRVTFFGIASVAIYCIPVHTLASFSLWHHLGIPAPSIGLTRAYHYILHANFTAAWHQNHLIYLVLAIGLPIITKDVYTMLKLKKGTIRHGRPKQQFSPTTTRTASSAE